MELRKFLTDRNFITGKFLFPPFERELLQPPLKGQKALLFMTQQRFGCACLVHAVSLFLRGTLSRRKLNFWKRWGITSDWDISTDNGAFLYGKCLTKQKLPLVRLPFRSRPGWATPCPASATSWRKSKAGFETVALMPVQCHFLTAPWHHCLKKANLDRERANFLGHTSVTRRNSSLCLVSMLRRISDATILSGLNRVRPEFRSRCRGRLMQWWMGWEDGIDRYRRVS